MSDIYPALVAELTGDPLGVGYASMSDAERLASLTAPTRSRPRRLASIEMFVWGGQAGRAARVRKAAMMLPPYDSLPDEALAPAIIADAILSRDDAGFDPADPEHVGMIDALVTASVLTAGDKDALMARASEPCSRADELGLANLGRGHMATARQMTGG